MAAILVLHGPNLNLLGAREPAHYGTSRLADIDADLAAEAERLGRRLTAFQSNREYELIERVQASERDGTGFIVINPAGFTHTSVALRDALTAVAHPFIEVHLSNIHRREPFRRHSYFSDAAVGVICGLGPLGYRHALRSAHEWLAAREAEKA